MNYYQEVDAINDHRDLPRCLRELKAVIPGFKHPEPYIQEANEIKDKLSKARKLLKEQTNSQVTEEVKEQLLNALRHLHTADLPEAEGMVWLEDQLSYKLTDYFDRALRPNALPKPELYELKDDGSVLLPEFRKFLSEAIEVLSNNEYDNYLQLEKAFTEIQSKHFIKYERALAELPAE